MTSDISPLKVRLQMLRSELGDDPDLVKQGFEDANALDRQNHRAHFESRIEYSRLVAQALLAREASVKEYGLQTLRWAFLLNAGAIALVAAYLGARTGGRPLMSVQSFAPVFLALWPFALGCVFVVIAGAAGYYNFSYSTGLLPSYEEMHNFHSPASAKWPVPRGMKADEEIRPFFDRMNSRLVISQRVAVAGCAGSMFCLLLGLWQVVASVS
jgi:hypothetical protein